MSIYLHIITASNPLLPLSVAPCIATYQTCCCSYLPLHYHVCRFQRRVLWAAGLCFTADSTEIMLLSFLSLTLQSEWGLTANQTASMTACVFAGSLVGTLTFGFLGDHWGRRPTFLLACACISLFGVLTAFATDYASLLGIRFMVGFGVGGITVPFDVFAEFLPTHARGKHLLIIEYFWTAGSMMTPLFAYWTLQSSWRLFVILCSLPCIVSGILGAFLCPESPRWLISVGRDEDAMAIIRSAAATNGKNPDELFKADVKLKDEHVDTSNFTDLVSKKWRKISALLWITWIGYAIGVSSRCVFHSLYQTQFLHVCFHLSIVLRHYSNCNQSIRCRCRRRSRCRWHARV